MSTTISTNQYQSILKEINYTSISKDKALEYDISLEEFEEADVDQNGELDLGELEDAEDVLAKLAVAMEQKDKKIEAEKDKEQEKEEQIQVKDKNDTGV